MAKKNKEETFYQMSFYLGSDCYTDFSELNNVVLRSKTIEDLAKKLNLVNNFRKNVFDISLYKSVDGKFSHINDEIPITIEQLEDWFKEKGIEL